MASEAYMVTSGVVGSGNNYYVESFRHRHECLANYGAVVDQCVDEAMAMAMQLLDDDPEHPDVLIRVRPDFPGADRPVAYLFGGAR
jgi:hypothetical protein